MNVSRPYGVISHPLDSTVLHVLAGTTDDLTGRRIAQLAGEGTQEGVRKALARLTGEGLIHQREAGNAILYRLNRQHLAAPAIEQLTDLRRALFRRLEETLEGWLIQPLHAAMFGSAARGDGDANSDIDLFVVRPAAVDEEDPVWREQVERLADDIRNWTGNRAGIAEVSESDLADLKRRKPPILDSLEADALTLAGRDVRVVLGGAA